MKRQLNWVHAVMALAAIAALAIVAPALGGPSLKKLVKKEVAKQLATATGPQGAQGIQGAQGLPGTALAYAHVESQGDVTESESKGVTDAMVTRDATNAYCFSGLGFTPKHIQVTPIGALNSGFADTAVTLARHTAIINTDTTFCTGTTEQATVIFYDGAALNSNMVGSGFYVLFE